MALLRGNIIVESIYGQGSSFIFSIPLQIDRDKTAADNDQVVDIDVDRLDFHGASVLLVEDSEMNQQVARELLEMVNIEVFIANNGQEAVTMSERRTYDLILMDIQMPVMDGFQATRLIQQQDKNIPIIAMTANALATDCAKSIKAGMVDHITKPITPADLYTSLGHYLASTVENKLAEVAYGGDSDAESEEMFANLKFIDSKKALLRTRDNQDLLIQILVNFKNKKTNIATKLSSAIEQQDYKSAKSLVHDLKGESGTIEATQLHAASIDLEKCLLSVIQEVAIENKNNLLEDLSRKLEHLTLSLTDVLVEIREFETLLGKNGDEKSDGDSLQKVTDNFDSSIIKSQLCELNHLLKDNNLEAKTLAKALNSDLKASSYVLQWNSILEAISELDFKLAQEKLTSLTIEMNITLY